MYAVNCYILSHHKHLFYTYCDHCIRYFEGEYFMRNSRRFELFFLRTRIFVVYFSKKTVKVSICKNAFRSFHKMQFQLDTRGHLRIFKRQGPYLKKCSSCENGCQYIEFYFCLKRILYCLIIQQYNKLLIFFRDFYYTKRTFC